MQHNNSSHMRKFKNDGSQLGQIHDAGGPTVTNNSPTGDSNKMRYYSKRATPPKAHPSKASGKIDKPHMNTEEYYEDDGYEDDGSVYLDVSEDISFLLNNNELSEEFKNRIESAYTTSMASRLNTEVERIHEEYGTLFEEKVSDVVVEMAEKVDNYLEYAVDKWIEENALQIEDGIKTQMNENFIDGVRELFYDNCLGVSDDEAEAVNVMAEQNDIMNGRLNDIIEENVDLRAENEFYVKNIIVSELSEGLTLSEKDKLRSLAEAVEFVDEESFSNTIDEFKQTYFNKASNRTHTLNEDVYIDENIENDPNMITNTLHERCINVLRR